MTFTESNTVEQMIPNVTTKLGGTLSSVLPWNTRPSEFSL